MKTKNMHRSIATTIKRICIWAVVIGVLLMIPIIGKFPWTESDFIFAGGVLFGCATSYEFLTRTLDNKIQRLAVGAGIGIVIMAIWAWAVA